MRISVVIPAFNEEGNIGRLIEETFAAVPETALGEVIAVDDGSDDGTGAEIKALLGTFRACAISGMAESWAKRRAQDWRAGPPAFRSSPPWMATAKTIRPTSCLFSDVSARKAVSLPWRPASGPAARGRDRARRRHASPISSVTKCSPTAAPIQVAASSFSAAKPFSRFPISRQCTAICRPCFSAMATKSPMRRSTIGRGSRARQNTPISAAPLIGLYDLVGVSWLRKRTHIPPIAEQASGASARRQRRATHLGVGRVGYSRGG